MLELGYVSTLLLGWLGIAVIMTVLWWIQILRRDASHVDVGWAAGLGLLAIWFAVAADGWGPRRLAIALVVGLWSFRLAYHLLTDRIIGKEEDGRYQTLRAKWADRANSRFFYFFQAQGLLDVILASPFLVICFNTQDSFHPVEWVGLALFVVAIGGETAADRQLARFKQKPDSKGKTCREGLWRYSRHPNYFFEWLIWCSYALVALAAPYGWLGLLSPIFMLLLILKVTGIPPTEQQALQSRGDDYRRYQQTTSAFVPWFPKKETA
jgi:steroid 5-alpha reductase family enzyme